MKTFELCYLGNASGSHRFRVTQITIDGQPDDKGCGDLFFKKPILKSLTIGAYALADTEDENTFKNWRRAYSPEKPLDADVISQFSIETIAKRAEKRANDSAKLSSPTADNIIEQLRDNMFMLSRAERAAFAMYVYQKLIK